MMTTTRHNKLYLWLPFVSATLFSVYVNERMIMSGSILTSLENYAIFPQIIIETITTTIETTPTTKSCQDIDMAAAVQCLSPHNNATTMTVISYPDDPYDHFLQLQQALEPYSMDHVEPHKFGGYGGPWIENHWQQWGENKTTAVLSNDNFCHTFGPYIPLLTAWTDVWMHHLHNGTLASILKQHLRKDVLYITVVQHAEGFPILKPEFEQILREYNIVVLSSGGYGHVPLPLFKQPEGAHQKILVADRQHLVSYTGSLGNAPRNMRQQMMNMVGMGDHYYKGKNWRNIMRNSKFQLCPRGYGRTAWHVMESFQMGLIPIHIYLKEDIPWMPYKTLIQNVSFTTDLEGLPALLEHLATIPDAQIEAMEAAIEQMTPIYFTFGGVIKQIALFMTSPHLSKLECRVGGLPKHPGVRKKRYFP